MCSKVQASKIIITQIMIDEILMQVENKIKYDQST